MRDLLNLFDSLIMNEAPLAQKTFYEKELCEKELCEKNEGWDAERTTRLY